MEYPEFRPMPHVCQARLRRLWYLEMKPIWTNYVIQGGDPYVICGKFGVIRNIVQRWVKEFHAKRAS